MKDSKIEWTDHTFNPWSGCTKVSPGCANCYAESLSKRAPKTLAGWGKGVPRKRTSVHNWNDPIRWNRAAELGMFRELYAADGTTVIYRGDMRSKDCPQFYVERKCVPVRPRVFCASLADWLDDEVPIEWLADLLALIQATPHLDWLLLTKRPENWWKRIADACHEINHGANADKYLLNPSAWLASWLGGNAPANIWGGTSVEDQKRADERIPALLRIPARVRFLSMEPLLGAVRLGGALYSDYDKAARQDQLLVPPGGFNNAKVNWVIVGGESGPGARPMHPEWARDLRDECDEAGTHFLFKQWGEWAPNVSYMPTPAENAGKLLPATVISSTDKDAEGTTVYHAYPKDISGGAGKAETMRRVGKKEAGRLLDGREWNEIPNGGAK